MNVYNLRKVIRSLNKTGLEMIRDNSVLRGIICVHSPLYVYQLAFTEWQSSKIGASFAISSWKRKNKLNFGAWGIGIGLAFYFFERRKQAKLIRYVKCRGVGDKRTVVYWGAIHSREQDADSFYLNALKNDGHTINFCYSAYPRFCEFFARLSYLVRNYQTSVNSVILEVQKQVDPSGLSPEQVSQLKCLLLRKSTFIKIVRSFCLLDYMLENISKKAHSTVPVFVHRDGEEPAGAIVEAKNLRIRVISITHSSNTGNFYAPPSCLNNYSVLCRNSDQVNDFLKCGSNFGAEFVNIGNPMRKISNTLMADTLKYDPGESPLFVIALTERRIIDHTKQEIEQIGKLLRLMKRHGSVVIRSKHEPTLIKKAKTFVTLGLGGIMFIWVHSKTQLGRLMSRATAVVVVPDRMNYVSQVMMDFALAGVPAVRLVTSSKVCPNETDFIRKWSVSLNEVEEFLCDSQRNEGLRDSLMMSLGVHPSNSTVTACRDKFEIFNERAFLEHFETAVTRF